MKSRCPTSAYHSFGYLRDYRWIIGERGYANVIKTPRPTAGAAEHVVYGMLYTLEPSDEEKLDVAEGVPDAYIKLELDISLESKDGGGDGKEERGNMDASGEVARALVYVDEKRLGEGVCVEEYVVRINRGVRDARSKGMGEWYVRECIRPFVREEDVPDDGLVEDPFHPSNPAAYDGEKLD